MEFDCMTVFKCKRRFCALCSTKKKKDAFLVFYLFVPPFAFAQKRSNVFCSEYTRFCIVFKFHTKAIEHGVGVFESRFPLSTLKANPGVGLRELQLIPPPPTTSLFFCPF